MAQMLGGAETGAARAEWRTWAVRGILACAALALAVRLVAFALHSIAAVGYPLPLDGIEGTLLDDVRRWVGGQPLYQPLGYTAFRSTPYPPLDFVAIAPLIKLGITPFVAGRLVSLGGAVVAGGLLAALVWRYTRSRFATFAAPALYAGVVPVYLWATRVKPDMLAATFTLAALYATQSAADAGRAGQGRAERVWLVAAGAGFIAAVYTKQLALFAPAATVLFLWMVRGWRVAVLWAGASAVVAAAIGAVLVALSGGAFYDQIVGYNAVAWSINRFQKFAVLVYPDWALLVGAALCAAWALSRYVGHKTAVPLLPLLYGLIAPFSLLFAGVYGANHNHIIETMQAEVLLGCVALALVLRQGRGALLAAALTLLALQTVYTFIIPDWYHDYELPPADQTARLLKTVAVVGNLARHSQPPRPVLADDVGLLIAANLAAPYNDPSTMGPLTEAGAWDAGGLLDMINTRQFAAIVLPFDVNAKNADAEAKGRWATAVLDAIRQNYSPLYRDTPFIYVPKR